MTKKSTTIFYRSGVSWFPVPQELFKGSKFKPTLIEELSAGALRLYLFLLSRAGSEQQSIVKVTNAAIAQKAKVTKNNLKNVREELEELSLIRVLPEEAAFEILSPSTGNRLPSSLPKVKAPKLTPEQVEAVFTHYIGQYRLEKDNKNGWLFICPWHAVGMGSQSKRKKNVLSVKNSETGIWNCTHPECSRHGSRRTKPVTDSWGDPFDEVVIGGGGDILDFVAAMADFNDGKPIRRSQAAHILEQLLPQLAT